MRRLGIHEHAINYVHETFSDAMTSIKVGQSATRQTNIKRGVKQGDPLSPLLFNMVIDELICKLESLGRGAH